MLLVVVVAAVVVLVPEAKSKVLESKRSLEVDLKNYLVVLLFKI